MENVISSLHETVHLFNLKQFINIISFQPDNYSTQLLFYRQKGFVLLRTVPDNWRRHNRW